MPKHELWLVLSVFITRCNIPPVYDDRKLSCTITHFPFAYIYIELYCDCNAINIPFSKSHVNQLRRVTEKTPLTVAGSRGSAPRAPLLAEKCDLGGIISVFCHWFPWLIPAPAGRQALPLDLKPIMWWWSRAEGCCECDVFGWESGGRNRINHQTVLEGAHFAVYFISLCLPPDFSSFPSSPLISIWTPFWILNQQICLSGSILCFCLLNEI